MKLWTLLALALVVSSGAFAQDEKDNSVKVKEDTKLIQQPNPAQGETLSPPVLAQKLSLNDEQKARVMGLWGEYRDRNERIRKDTSIQSEQKIQRLRQSREEYANLIRSLLNEEQLKKFEELLKADERQPGATNARLSQEQIAKIREVTTRYQKLQQDVQRDNSLTPQQKQKRLEELRNQMMQEVRGALPDELRAQMDKANKAAEKKDEKKEDKKEEKKEGDDKKETPPDDGKKDKP